MASWLVEDGHLYLNEIKDILGEDGNVLNLETVFPGYADGVFAHWYSGTFNLPQGEIIKPSPHWNIFERDLILVFRKGVLISENVVANKIAEDEVELPQSAFPPIINREIDEKGNPQIIPGDLLAKVTLEEIEILETPRDPLNRAPAVPFGFFNLVWKSFTEHLPANAEICAFEMIYRKYHWTDEYDKMYAGYACVKNEQVYPVFFSPSP